MANTNPTGKDFPGSGEEVAALSVCTWTSPGIYERNKFLTFIGRPYLNMFADISSLLALQGVLAKHLQPESHSASYPEGQGWWHSLDASQKLSPQK